LTDKMERCKISGVAKIYAAKFFKGDVRDSF